MPLLGVEAFGESHGVDHVGEEHAHVLALSFERAAGGEDLLDKMPRGVGAGVTRRHRRAGTRRERRAAGVAELLARRIEGPAAPAGHAVERGAALAAEAGVFAVLVPAVGAPHARESSVRIASRPAASPGSSGRLLTLVSGGRNPGARQRGEELDVFQGREHAMAEGTDLFEIIHTTRAMRRLKPDPVPDELIRKILQAGVCAASGGNSQRWRFLIIKDPAIKQAVQKYYKRAFDEVVGPRYATSAPPLGVTKERYQRQHAAVEYLTDHFHEAPVWIVACIEEGTATPSRSSGASIYPAVQNMLLAARALGLGATLTTRHLLFEKETEAALGLPPGVRSYAILPIGYPMGRFGPVGRGPLSDVVYEDRWGQPYRGL